MTEAENGANNKERTWVGGFAHPFAMLEKTLLCLPKQQAVGFSAIILSLSAVHNTFVCTCSSVVQQPLKE
jgi:hypothetical protein